MAYVELKKEDNIAVISINRPEALNALSGEIVDELGAAAERISSDDEIRCVIIYSKDNFAAGADIKAMADCDEKSAGEFSFSPVYNKIADLKIPVIAAIEGYALGGGMELAMTADIRLADKEARIGFPETTLGIFPGAGGTVRVPRIAGPSYAMELIFTGDIITADRAAEMGLVNRVTEGSVYEAALKLAGRISKRAPVAVRLAKETIKAGMSMTDTAEAVELEASNWSSLFSTEDQKEGMKAFIEKRKPVFRNR